jgi:hypothetical protein
VYRDLLSAELKDNQDSLPFVVIFRDAVTVTVDGQVDICDPYNPTAAPGAGNERREQLSILFLLGKRFSDSGSTNVQLLLSRGRARHR